MLKEIKANSGILEGFLNAYTILNLIPTMFRIVTFDLYILGSRGLL